MSLSQVLVCGISVQLERVPSWMDTDNFQSVGRKIQVDLSDEGDSLTEVTD